jgi:hypothetical protein
MLEIGTSGLMSGDGKRSVAAWPKLPRPSSTLPALKDAIAHARVLGKELAEDRDWDGFVISVTDADGRLAAQIPVRS